MNEEQVAPTVYYHCEYENTGRRCIKRVPVAWNQIADYQEGTLVIREVTRTGNPVVRVYNNVLCFEPVGTAPGTAIDDSFHDKFLAFYEEHLRPLESIMAFDEYLSEEALLWVRAWRNVHNRVEAAVAELESHKTGKYESTR